MNDVFERPMPPNPYEKNKTMKLLGKQFMVSVILAKRRSSQSNRRNCGSKTIFFLR